MCTSSWFEMLGTTLRSIVVDYHGGAIVMTREGIKEALVESNPDLKDCPASVMSHPTLCFKKFDLAAHPYVEDGSILLIFDPTMHSQRSAKRHCRANGLSPQVRTALLERVPVPA